MVASMMNVLFQGEGWRVEQQPGGDSSVIVFIGTHRISMFGTMTVLVHRARRDPSPANQLSMIQAALGWWLPAAGKGNRDIIENGKDMLFAHALLAATLPLKEAAAEYAGVWMAFCQAFEDIPSSNPFGDPRLARARAWAKTEMGAAMEKGDLRLLRGWEDKDIRNSSMVALSERGALLFRAGVRFQSFSQSFALPEDSGDAGKVHLISSIIGSLVAHHDEDVASSRELKNLFDDVFPGMFEKATLVRRMCS